MTKRIFFSLILLMSQTIAARAADTPKDEKKLDQILVDKDKEITKKIDSIANDIDVALSGEKTTRMTNLTRITLRNQFNLGEAGSFVYTPHIDLQLRLPHLEKKWRLKFTTYDEDQANRGINRNRLKTSPDREDYGGSIALLQKLGQVNAEFQPRVEIRQGVQVSYILKLTSVAKSEFLTLHPEAQFFARSDSGVGQYLGLDFDVPLYKTLVLTPIDEEQYVDQENIFSTNNGLRLGFEYNDRMSQSVSLMFESSSRPNYHLDRYTVAVGFMHRLYRNVLHYTAIPYLTFPRGTDFKGSPGINFELDIIF